jgi:hypothetical protein
MLAKGVVFFAVLDWSEIEDLNTHVACCREGKLSRVGLLLVSVKENAVVELLSLRSTSETFQLPVCR